MQVATRCFETTSAATARIMRRTVAPLMRLNWPTDCDRSQEHMTHETVQ